MYLTTNRAAKLSFLSLMYLAQGLPWGFVSVALTGYMYEQGMSTTDVGTLLAMAMWPWPFKWALGPIIDRWSVLSMGRRRPWIILAQTCMVLSTLTILSVPDITSSVRLLGLVLMFHNCFVAMQDVGVDALAVDILKGGERERANAVMFASSHIGTFMGSAGLGFLIGLYNFHVGLWVLVSLQISLLLVPLLLRERPGEKIMPWTKGRAQAEVLATDNKDIYQLGRRVVRAFSLRTTILGVVLALTVMAGMMMTTLIAQRYIIQDVYPNIFSMEAGGELIEAFERGEVPAEVQAAFLGAGYDIGGVEEMERSRAPWYLRIFPKPVTPAGEDADAGIIHPRYGTEVAVEKEGAWKVDREKGEIRFVPVEGFFGESTPVEIEVGLVNGDEAVHLVRVAVFYAAPGAMEPEVGVDVLIRGKVEDERGMWRKLFRMAPSEENVPRTTEFKLIELLTERIGLEEGVSLDAGSIAIVGVDTPGDWVVRGGKPVAVDDLRAWEIRYQNVPYRVVEVGQELLVQRGWTQARYSVFSGTTVVTAVLSALLGGFLGSRFGVRKIAGIGTVLLGGTWMVFAFILAPQVTDGMVVLFMHVDQFFTGLLTVALWAMFMQISWPVVAATQFTAYMAMLNVGRIIGSQFAGVAEGYVGKAHWAVDAARSMNIETVPMLLFVAGGIQIAILVIILLIDPTQTRRVLGELDGEGKDGEGESSFAGVAPSGN